jgi:hypothetical protein
VIDWLRDVLRAFDVLVLVYFLVLNSIYLTIMVMATLAIALPVRTGPQLARAGLRPDSQVRAG